MHTLKVRSPDAYIEYVTPTCVGKTYKEDYALGHRTREISTAQVLSLDIAAGAVLVTNNVREFERVPGLKLEDWAK